jgi:SAM-dependent methyltransferase
MVFAEYRGGGRASRDTTNMPAIWNAQWTQTACSTSVDHLAMSEHWPLIQQYIPPPQRVLEAGCGLGRWVRFLDEHGYETHGADFAATGIAGAQARWPGLRVLVADLRAMPYETGFFDAIVSFGAIEHDVDGPADILAEMRRVLAPGGILYCTVPCMNGIRRTGVAALDNWIVRNRMIRRLAGRTSDAVFFEYVFKPREYRDILEQAGYQVLHLIPLCPSEDWSGREGGLRWKMFKALHNWRPWLTAHMMAAVCRKV